MRPFVGLTAAVVLALTPAASGHPSENRADPGFGGGPHCHINQHSGKFASRRTRPTWPPGQRAERLQRKPAPWGHSAWPLIGCGSLCPGRRDRPRRAGVARPVFVCAGPAALPALRTRVTRVLPLVQRTKRSPQSLGHLSRLTAPPTIQKRRYSSLPLRRRGRCVRAPQQRFARERIPLVPSDNGMRAPQSIRQHSHRKPAAGRPPFIHSALRSLRSRHQSSLWAMRSSCDIAAQYLANDHDRRRRHAPPGDQTVAWASAASRPSSRPRVSRGPALRLREEEPGAGLGEAGDRVAEQTRGPLDLRLRSAPAARLDPAIASVES